MRLSKDVKFQICLCTIFIVVALCLILLSTASPAMGQTTPPDTLRVPGCGNLEIKAVQHDPPNIDCGLPLRVRAQVWNSGIQSVPISDVAFYVNGNKVKVVSVQALQPAQIAWTIWTEIERPNPPGEYYLSACADDGDVIDESNEDDNCRGM